MHLVLVQSLLRMKFGQPADCTKKELNEFLESMNSSQFKDIEKFFETMPKLSHTVKVKNPKTKKESDVVIEGLASFFA